MNGFLIVNKPLGRTSSDSVIFVRKRLPRGTAVGHGGTLDPEAMRRAAAYLEGEHDFSAFCGNPKFKKSTVRFIRSVRIERTGEELRISFTGNGFIHNQVRIMVGTLIEVGRGDRSPDSIPALFGGKREKSGFLAPAQGLCLMEVTY